MFIMYLTAALQEAFLFKAESETVRWYDKKKDNDFGIFGNDICQGHF